MSIDINLFAVLGAAVAAMVVGWLWFGLIFRAVWTRLAQLADRPAAKDAVIYPIALVVNLLGAFVLAYISSASQIANQNSLLEAALYSAVFVWFGGYYLISAESLDQAIELASALPMPSGALEIRPVAFRPDAQ